jgi:hypothetical protein
MVQPGTTICQEDSRELTRNGEMDGVGRKKDCGDF